MNNLTRPLFVVFSLIFIGLPAAFAQPRTAVNASPPTAKPKKEILTNATIIELAQLGLGDAIIIEKIRQSECNFDTSLDGFKQLKAAKVSEAIIAVMLNPKANAVATPTPTPTGQVKAVAPAPTVAADAVTPREPGIYFQNQGNLVEINPTTFTGTKSSFLGTTLTYGIKKTKMRAVVRGAAANTIIPNSRPVFYFYFHDITGDGHVRVPELWRNESRRVCHGQNGAQKQFQRNGVGGNQCFWLFHRNPRQRHS